MSEKLKTGLLITSVVCNAVMLLWLIGLTAAISLNRDRVESQYREIEEAFLYQNAKIEAHFRSPNK